MVRQTPTKQTPPKTTPVWENTIAFGWNIIWRLSLSCLADIFSERKKQTFRFGWRTMWFSVSLPLNIYRACVVVVVVVVVVIVVLCRRLLGHAESHASVARHNVGSNRQLHHRGARSRQIQYIIIVIIIIKITTTIIIIVFTIINYQQ